MSSFLQHKTCTDAPMDARTSSQMRKGVLVLAALGAISLGGPIALLRHVPSVSIASPVVPIRLLGVHNGDASLVATTVPTAIARPAHAVGEPTHKALSWVSVGLELEMQPLHKSVGFRQAAELTQEALVFAGSLNSSQFEGEPERLDELKTLDVVPRERTQIGSPRRAWAIHPESDPGPLFELVSPWLRFPTEVDLAVAATEELSHNFGGGRFAALHITVDGRCLLANGGIMALWLMWERFHGQLKSVLARRKAAATYGPSLQDKHPELLEALQAQWEQHPAPTAEDVGKLLEKLHSGMDKYIKKGFLSGLERRDGYRNFAVNVCHLLPVVRCCADCDKNRTPKHGGIEFRIFDVAYGERLRLLVTLVQRLVLRVCEASRAAVSSLRPLLMLKGDLPSSTLSPLLTFLGIDETQFHVTFRDRANEDRRHQQLDKR